MPSKYGFGNTRKKSPYKMGGAHYGMDQKNPIKQEKDYLGMGPAYKQTDGTVKEGQKYGPKNPDPNMSAQARNTQALINKKSRLEGEVITDRQIWAAMQDSDRKKYGGSYDTYVKEAEKFRKENPDYKHGSGKYKQYQGTF
jgi:hypothetical protein|tara:strand:+ start:194 stop:616 length:423 start_codon:yes stop_codon:yes gene_type:complete